jgi:HAD superfamily hydrolase (TIGR01549 family)
MDPPAPLLRAELPVPVDPERAETAFRAEIAYYLEHHVEGRDERSLDDLRDRCAAVLRDALGEPRLDLATVRRAMLASIRFEAYADAAPALRELRARGLRVVVASNWDYTLPTVLARIGLSDLVDRVVTSAELGVAKPDPRFFGRALGDLPAESAVYVGDSPANDVGAATAAGMRAVLLRRGERRLDAVDPDPPARAPSIERLTDLAALI